MRIFRIGIVLLLIMIFGIFLIQNIRVIEVQFLHWTLETSRALLILGCVAFGSLITLIAILPTLFRKGKRSSHQDTNVEEED